MGGSIGRPRGGFDLIAQGMGGIMHVTGEPDAPPISVGLPICDLGTGMWAAQGILAALYERQRIGKGRLVQCSLSETAIGFSSWTSAQWLADHQEPTRQGSRYRQNAPYQRTQTKDGYLMVGVAGEAIWARCAKYLGHPEWCEDRVLQPTSSVWRTAPHPKPRSRRCSPRQPPSIGSRRLRQPTCPAAQSMITLRCSPTRRCANAASCNIPATRNWARCRISAPRSPKLGQHNAEIFGRLGMTKAEVRELQARGIL
jgi:crotonobetainyl-CoA:carnitine CoA-transferase CaiB-like acyl-CoA transferase